MVQQGAAGGRARGRPGRADQGAAPRGPPGPEDPGRRRAGPGGGRTCSYADVDALFRAIGEHHVSGRVGRAAHLPRAAQRRGRRGPAHQRPRPPPGSGRATATSASTSRASTTSWSGCPAAARRCPATRSWASSPAAAASSVHRADCANAVALMSDQSARLIEVEWDDDTAGARSWPRSRSRRSTGHGCCGTSPNVLSEHHVNIVACSTHTGSDRVARMRFEFELADPGHLDAVLRTIKTHRRGLRRVPHRRGGRLAAAARRGRPDARTMSRMCPEAGRSVTRSTDRRQRGAASPGNALRNGADHGLACPRARLRLPRRPAAGVRALGAAAGHLRRSGRAGRVRLGHHTADRAPRGVPAGRRVDRHRPQGDVRLRGQGRPAGRGAPGDHGRARAGLRRAPPGRAVEGRGRPAPTSATRPRRRPATGSTSRSTPRSSGRTTRMPTSRSSPSSTASTAPSG